MSYSLLETDCLRPEEDLPEVQVAFEDEASMEANLIGFPIVMTIVCNDIPKNVTVIREQKNIKNELELREKYREMMKRFSDGYPDSSIEGVFIQK